ncbi:hypothetical protein N9Y42_06330 [Mariniblastus sp.]|nr:hypothetical protein [Mariniblastus sp.]
MKTLAYKFQGSIWLLSVALIAGCENADRTELRSNAAPNADRKQLDESTPTGQSEFNEQPQATESSSLENDSRPDLTKQLHGISSEMIASAEQYLLALGVDRKYNITGSFVGGLATLDLELLPNARGNKSLGIQIYFHPGPNILGGSEDVVEWLEQDDRLFENENTVDEYAE